MRVWKTVYSSLARSLLPNGFAVARPSRNDRFVHYVESRPVTVSTGATGPLSMIPEDSEFARACARERESLDFTSLSFMSSYRFFVIAASLCLCLWNYGDCFVIPLLSNELSVLLKKSLYGYFLSKKNITKF